MRVKASLSRLEMELIFFSLITFLLRLKMAHSILSSNKISSSHTRSMRFVELADGKAKVISCLALRSCAVNAVRKVDRDVFVSFLHLDIP